jgi:hypothetical protein
MSKEVIEKKTILEESIKKFKGVRGGLTVLGINDIDDLREIGGESKEGVALKMDDLPETITGVRIMTEEVIEKVAEIISRGRHIDTVYVKPFDNENKIYEAMRKPWKKLAIKVLLKLESLHYVQKDPDQSLPLTKTEDLLNKIGHLEFFDRDVIAANLRRELEVQQDMIKAGWVKVKRE